MKEMFHLFAYHHCLWFFFGTAPVCTTLPIPGGANILFAFRLAAWSPSAPVLCVAHVKNSFKLHHCPLFHAVHKLWCWQPLQRQLNPVKYLGGFDGLGFFKMLKFSVVCTAAIPCGSVDSILELAVPFISQVCFPRVCLSGVSMCMLSRQWPSVIILSLEQVNM